MLTLIKLTLTSLFWAGTFIAGKKLGGYVTPALGAFMRFLAASLCLLPLLLKVSAGKRVGNLPTMAWIGIAGIASTYLYNIFFLKGLQLIESSRASLIVATCPIFITIVSVIFTREKLHMLQIPGILLGVIGAIIVITRGQLDQIFSGLGRGELLIFGCVTCWVVYTMISRRIADRVPPVTVVAWCCMIGTVCLLPGAWSEWTAAGRPIIPFYAWLYAGYLAVFGNALGFIWYNEGLEKIGPTRTGIFINLIPPFTMLLSYLILKETIGLPTLIGALLVLAGLFLTNRPVSVPRE